MRIAQEEIFGPVLVIMPYDRRGRGGAHRQRDGLRPQRARPVGRPRCSAARGRAASAPGRCTSTTRAWSADAPFGGYKHSGNGREYGVEGLEEYLEIKAILGYMEGPAPAAA